MLFPQFYLNQYYGMRFDTPMRANPNAYNFAMVSTDGESTSVGAYVEADKEGIFKFFAVEDYNAHSISLMSLDLDAEIY